MEKNLSDEEFSRIVEWVYHVLEKEHNNNNNVVVEIETIDDILILILKQKMEVMTIWNNERNFTPNLTVSTLWRIFNLLMVYKEDIYFPQ